MAFETGIAISAKASLAVVLCLALPPACAFAEEPDNKHGGIDTEHIYGFMIGSDVGDPGEREFQTTMTGRFLKQAGSYQALDQQLELEFLPFRNFRIGVGATLAAYDIFLRAGFGEPEPGRLAGRYAGFALQVF